MNEDQLPRDHFLIDLQLLNIPILASHFSNQYLPGLLVMKELFPFYRDYNQDKHGDCPWNPAKGTEQRRTQVKIVFPA